MGEDFNLDNLKEWYWQAVDSNGKVLCEGKCCKEASLSLSKKAQEFELPPTLDDDNNELLKPENHNKELSLTLDVQPTKEFLRLFEDNIFYKLKKIRKKYRSPKRRVQEYNKFFRR